MSAYRRSTALVALAGMVCTGAVPLRHKPIIVAVVGHAALQQARMHAATGTIVAVVGVTPVTINGTVAMVASVHNENRLMVALDPITKNLGILSKHRGASLVMNVDNSWISVTPDDMVVREGDAPMMRLSTMPQKRAGKLFVDSDDVGNLLDVATSRDGNHLTVSRKQKDLRNSEQSFTVSEIATPTPKPKPIVTQAPHALDAYDVAPPGRKVLGRASLHVNQDAYNRYYDAAFDGKAGAVQASLLASGSAGGRPMLGGTVRLGDGPKHVAVGGVQDPLYGELFAGSGSTGIEYQSSAGITAGWGNSTIGSRHTIAVGKRTQNTNAELAFVSQNGHGLQTLLGLEAWRYSGNGYLGREFWIGRHGIGADLHYRTTGKIYGEAKIGFAGAGLPLVNGDAATLLGLGVDFNALSFHAGLTGSHDAKTQGTVGVSARFRAFDLSVQRYGQQDLFAADVHSGHAQGTIAYSVTPASSQLAAQMQFEAARGILETMGYLTRGGDVDTTLDYRLKRDGPAMSFGGEVVSGPGGGRIGPVLGYSTRISNGIETGVQIHPLLHGMGVRFTVQQAIFGSNGPRQQFVTIASSTPAGTPLTLLIDGAPGQAVNGVTRAVVPAGSHYLSLQSADGRYGSPEQRIVDGSPATITLPLWPIDTVSGQITVPKSVMDILQTSPQLGGITVLIEPGNLIAQTDDDGRFTFPAQPLQPNSTIVVDATTLPDGLAAPAAQAVIAGKAVHFVLQSSKKVEKIVF